MPNQQQQQSSSSTGGDSSCCQLKAGHPPAVKVGNMRVTQRSHSISSNHSDKNDDDKSSDNSTVPKACSFAPKTDVNQSTSGLPEKIVENAFAEAVKHYNEKPMPTHDNRNHVGKPNHIQQPKK